MCPRACKPACMPSGRGRITRLLDTARATDRDRRVPRRRHRDERARRRRLRADRGRRGARRRRRAARPLGLAGAHASRRCAAASSASPGSRRRWSTTRPRPRRCCPQLQRRLSGRVLVAHNAPFDRRVLRQAFERVGLEWPDPPGALHRRAGADAAAAAARARLGALADALGHRGRRRPPGARRRRDLRARAVRAVSAAVRERVDDRRRGRAARPRRQQPAPRPPQDAGERARPAPRGARSSTSAELPTRPRRVPVPRRRRADAVRRQVGLDPQPRPRALRAVERRRPTWTAHAEIVDYRSTNSELGALVLENRLIKELRPPGNMPPDAPRRPARATSAAGSTSRSRSSRWRPSRPPATRSRSARCAAGGWRIELVEQLDSLFGLRHCGRRLPRREHPSAYGQMGRCLSPCLGDLDPNLYRRRLDEALRLFVDGGDGRDRLIAHVERQMREAAAAQQLLRARRVAAAAGAAAARDPRAARRRARGHARAAAADARPAPGRRPALDAFWLVGGRLVDWGPLPGDADELERRTQAALRARRPGRRARRARAARRGRRGADRRHVPGLASGHAAARSLAPRAPDRVERLAARWPAQRQNGSSTTSAGAALGARPRPPSPAAPRGARAPARSGRAGARAATLATRAHRPARRT